MNQATVDRALRALSEMGVASSAPAERIPPMPQGVRLVRWEPKPAPVLLTHMAVVTDVIQFICTTLAELGKTLRSKQGPAAHRKVRDLVDQLEECGVVVKISGVGSPSGGR